jgi:hypothetical protein
VVKSHVLGFQNHRIPLKFESGSSSHFTFTIDMDAIALAHTDQNNKAPADQSGTERSLFQDNHARFGVRDRVPPSLFDSSFGFVVNGSVIESDIADAVVISLLAREQLCVDYCAREFVFCESWVGSAESAFFSDFSQGLRYPPGPQSPR